MSSGREQRPASRSGRTGRRPGISSTRDEILTAARYCFARHGYDATSLRKVAARASVDPALVRRFFGSKEKLLIAALNLTFNADKRFAEVVERDPETLGEELIDYILSLWEQPDARDVLTAMIRSAATNPRAAKLLANFFSRQVLAQIAGALDDDEAQLRATLAGSQIVGLAFYRYILKLEPIASATPAALRSLVAPTLQRYLTHPLDQRND